MRSSNRLLSEERKIRKLAKKGQLKPQPLISLNGYRVLFKGTLNIIQGQAGTHKSRFAEHIASILINPQSIGLTENGFETQTRSRVLYVDTERSPLYNLPDSLNRIKRLSERNKVSRWLNLTSIMQLRKHKRLEMMDEYINKIVSKSKNIHHVIIIDVLTDLIHDFNNPTESMALIDTLNRAVMKYRCTVITIIHENPNSINKKARGHLGTEMHNKATNVFSLSTSGNQIKVEVLKSRNTALPPSFLYSYSDKDQMLKRVDTDAGYTFDVSQKFTVQDLITFLGNRIIGKVSRRELLKDLKVRYGKSEKTFDIELKKLVKSKTQITLVNGVPHTLQTERKSNLYYFLAP